MAGRVAYYGNIVKNGLILDLDAAKRDSYPGSGTTWRDIANGVITGSLINGPTFDSGNGGSIVFDGVDDYINNVGTVSTFSFIQNTGIFTISTWIKPAVLNRTHYFLGNTPTTIEKGFFHGLTSSNNLRFVITRGNASAVIDLTTTTFLSTTDWVNIIIVGDGSTVAIYKNGSLFQTSSGMTNFPTGDSSRTLNIGKINNYNPETFQGNISISQIYNRSLSSAEVTQNYNALKGRYGL